MKQVVCPLSLDRQSSRDRGAESTFDHQRKCDHEAGMDATANTMDKGHPSREEIAANHRAQRRATAANSIGSTDAGGPAGGVIVGGSSAFSATCEPAAPMPAPKISKTRRPCEWVLLPSNRTKPAARQ
jgi:hypothetical protein